MRGIITTLTVVAATALSGSCIRACGCSVPLEEAGFIQVSVRDQVGFPVADARASFVPDVGVPTYTGRTGSTGDLVVFVGTGAYSLNVLLPDSYATAPGQAETVRVLVEEDDTAHVLYRAVRSP